MGRVEGRGRETGGGEAEERERGSGTIGGEIWMAGDMVEDWVSGDWIGVGWPGESLTLFAGNPSSKSPSGSGIWCID